MSPRRRRRALLWRRQRGPPHPAAGRGPLRPAEPRLLPGEGWQGWGCGVEGKRDGERGPLRPPLKAFVAC